ncbi:MAG TPA: hypothetical protein VF449_06610 [Parvibaculum sp.]
MKIHALLAVATLTLGLAAGFSGIALADDDSTTDTQVIGSDPQTGGATQQDQQTMDDIHAQIEQQKQEQQAPQQ